MDKFRRYIIFAVGFFILSALSRTIFEYRKNYAFYEEYKKEYEKEKKRNIELQTQYVKTKDSYEFEKIARNKLDLHKSNEYVIVIPEPTATPVPPTPTVTSNYREWLEVFMKN